MPFLSDVCNFRSRPCILKVFEKLASLKNGLWRRVPGFPGIPCPCQERLEGKAAQRRPTRGRGEKALAARLLRLLAKFRKCQFIPGEKLVTKDRAEVRGGWAVRLKGFPLTRCQALWSFQLRSADTCLLKNLAAFCLLSVAKIAIFVRCLQFS